MQFPRELAWAHPVTAEWFTAKFGSPTEPQIYGWPSILAGDPTLISAPTGSGKTLAAFLVCIDKLLRQSIDGSLPAATQVVYVSPLKALSNDIQKNLDGPLAEIQQLALRSRLSVDGHSHRSSHWRYAAWGARRHAQAAASHSGHHPGVALHPAHRRQEPRTVAQGAHRHR